MKKIRYQRPIFVIAVFAATLTVSLLIAPTWHPAQCSPQDQQCEVLKERISKPRNNIERNKRGYYCEQMKDRGCPEYKALCEDSTGTTSACGLGVRWDESEAGWKGSWARRGDTNTFDATWTKGGEKVTATLTITINGNAVTVERPNASDSNDCTYTGTIGPDGKTIKDGTYTSCTQGGQKAWSATIICP